MPTWCSPTAPRSPSEELAELVTEKLGWAWAPRSFDFVDELPRTGSGKTNTRQLREKYAAEHVLVESTAD